MGWFNDTFGFDIPLITGKGSIGDALFGESDSPGLFSDPQGAWDEFKNGRTNTVNEDIAKQNLEYQKERNEIEDARYEEETAYNRAFSEDERAYNRALQQQIFEREDTALERQASSLSSMGINPLSQNMSGLGAGQAVQSAAAPVSSSRGGQALHNDFQMQDMGLLQAITPLMSLFQGVSDLETGMISRDGMRQQNDYQRLLNQEKEVQNRFEELRLAEEIKNLQADTKHKDVSTESVSKATKRAEEKQPIEVRNLESTTERNERVNAFQDKYGITDESSIYAKILTDIENQANRGGFGPDNIGNSPLNTGINSFKHSMEIVGNALNNTVGKGARAIYNYFTKPKKSKKSKKYDSSYEDAIKNQLMMAGW